MSKHKAVWTHPEDLIMRRYYRSATKHELLALLPGKTYTQIKSHAAWLSIKRGFPVGNGRYMRYSTDAADKPLFTPERDSLHVTACLAGGGFPRVQVINGQATWLWPHARVAA